MGEVGEIQNPENIQPSQDVFLESYPDGWRAAFKEDAKLEDPGIIRIGKNGTIHASGGNKDWGYDNASFKNLYRQAVEFLRAQGVEFAASERIFPQTEALIQQITMTGERELDLNTDRPRKGDIVLLVGNQHHPDFKKEDNVVYIGKVEDSSIEGRRISVKFQKEKSKSPIETYEGWELLYSHFTPEDEHITHAHHGDIESATIDKGKGEEYLRLSELLGLEKVTEESNTDEEL